MDIHPEGNFRKMTKNSPGYETGWHTTGTIKALPSVEQVAQRLDANPDVIMHGLNPESPDGWWTYDAVWMVGDIRVRGRLNIHNQHPGQPKDPAKDALDPHAYDPAVKPIEGYFHVFAEANRPWDPHWPSPLNVFLERKLRPSYVAMEYGTHNTLHMALTTNLPKLLDALADLQWVATVLTHDEMDMGRFAPKDDVRYDMPLISRLPASLYGRVIDVRVMGEETRTKANRALSKFGTSLPKGGVAILLSNPRRKGIPKAELSFKLDKPFVEGGDITAVVQSLSKMLTGQVMQTDTLAIDELRNDWTLLTPEERVQSDAERIAELEGQVVQLRDALTSTMEFNDRFRTSGEDLARELTKAQEREQKAIEREKKLRSELDRMLCMLRDGGLTKEVEARKEAEENVAAAEELLDEQSREVARLRQENSRLRRELASLGGVSAYSPEATEEEAPPATWDDFLEKAAALEYVVLGDVESGIDKLRRQVQEENWLNRTWEAVRALDEYARLKKERGPEELPHFRAYLEDPLAEHAIPRTRYSSTESKGVMMNSRFVAARTFPVPRQVDPSGKVIMEAHIRIGSGKPPAPRMHLHDDTSGATGKIYIGHIGPHLPNYQTN